MNKQMQTFIKYFFPIKKIKNVLTQIFFSNNIYYTFIIIFTKTSVFPEQNQSKGSPLIYLVISFWNFIYQRATYIINKTYMFFFDIYPDIKLRKKQNIKFSFVVLLTSLITNEDGSIKTDSQIHEQINNYLTQPAVHKAYDELIWKLIDEALSDPSFTELKKIYMTIPSFTTVNDFKDMYETVLTNPNFTDTQIKEFWYVSLKFKLEFIRFILLFHKENNVDIASYNRICKLVTEGQQLSSLDKKILFEIESLFKFIDGIFYYYAMANQTIDIAKENIIHSFENFKTPTTRQWIMREANMKYFEKKGFNVKYISIAEKFLILFEKINFLFKDVASTYYSISPSSEIWKKKIIELEEYNKTFISTQIDTGNHFVDGKTIWDLLAKAKHYREIKKVYPSFNSKKILFDQNSWVNSVQDKKDLKIIEQPFEQITYTNKVKMRWVSRKMEIFSSHPRFKELEQISEKNIINLNSKQIFNKEEIISDNNIQLIKSTNIEIFLIFIVSALFLSIIIVNINRFFSNSNITFDRSKTSSYECGFQPFEQLDKSQLFIFYRLSVFFIIFEAELIVLYPWAVNMASQNMFEGSFYYFYSPVVFVFIIIYGFYLEIKNKALDILYLWT